ncbi:hypothetical protein [Candidatus Palauibacter sp.]|uniref:hypothetical protein n=1 Tax=Candidatus Palauibacter sp. TaxID=3101350 RepID=UPI003B5A9049
MYAAYLFLRVRLWYRVIRYSPLAEATPRTRGVGGRWFPFDSVAGAEPPVITAKILDPLRMQVTEGYSPLRTAISMRWANRAFALDRSRVFTVQVVARAPFMADGLVPGRPFASIRLTVIPLPVPLALGSIHSNSSRPSPAR